MRYAAVQLACAGIASLLVVAAAPVGHAQVPDAARVLAARMAWVPNHRARVEHGVFRRDASLRWSIRPARRCLAELRALGVPFREQRWTPTPVPTPVVIGGDVGGVAYHKTRPVPLIVSCELAVRLPALSEVLVRHGVERVDVMSAYRRDPSTSFHAFGLALDIPRFHRRHDVLSVVEDYEITPGHPTCTAPAAANEEARALRALACDLARSSVWSTVLTPSYDEGHRDHFHIDARPDDPRGFVR